MSFISFNFLVFYLVTLVLVRGVLTDWKSRKRLLLCASYYFYMAWDWRFGSLLAALTLINYFLGQRVHDEADGTRRKLYMAVAIIASLGILGYFKYVNFFIESSNALLSAFGFQSALPLLSVILPVGISFYTFQSITYPLDIYRGKLEPIHNFWDFALFISFFPQLVAGPIVRASFFIPQLAPGHRAQASSLETGFALMIRGFIKKMALADVLALQLVDPAFSNPADYSPLFLLIGLYAYTFQVYLDFSGYTDIARGLARTLGYELPINFNRPYLAPTVSNFWQRWHISMSSFFREYLYYGLGGSKRGNVYVNLLITFVAIGIWHGAGWNFVAYGVLHAVMVSIERFLRNRQKARGLQPRVDIEDFQGVERIMRIALTFHAVVFARILFRTGSLHGAVEYSSALLNFSQHHFPVGTVGLTVLGLAVLLHFSRRDWADLWVRQYCRLTAAMQAIVLVVTVFVLVALTNSQAPFVYFQF